MSLLHPNCFAFSVPPCMIRSDTGRECQLKDSQSKVADEEDNKIHTRTEFIKRAYSSTRIQKKKTISTWTKDSKGNLPVAINVTMSCSDCAT